MRCLNVLRSNEKEKRRVEGERRIGNLRRKGLGEGNWRIILKIPLETQALWVFLKTKTFHCYSFHFLSFFRPSRTLVGLSFTAAISHKSDELSLNAKHNSLRLPLIMNVNAMTLKQK